MALSFDDLIEAEGGMNVPLDLEVPTSLFDVDNPSCDIIQTGMKESKDVWPKQSPFHESDSGMSEDFCSVGSPESVNLFERQDSGKMLDELVESLDIEPFCSGSDQDLANYFGGKLSDDVENDINGQNLADSLIRQVSASASDESRPSSPETTKKVKKVLRARPVKSVGKTAPSAFKPVQPQTVKPATTNSVLSNDSSNVPSVKVLKVIKTSGSANTATEVLKALDERNKKNAVQAKINREKKKQYIRSLEDEVSTLKSENCKLQTENDCMRQRTASLEEEVEYLRAVLANESGLSKVLGSIQNVKNVKLRSSFVSRKRSAEMDHDYTPSSKRRNTGSSTAGVCLHVDNDTVSLEFCSKCAKMAKSADDSE